MKKIVLVLVLLALLIPAIGYAKESEYVRYRQCRFVVKDYWRRSVGTAYIQASVKWENTAWGRKVRYTHAYGYAIGNARRNWFYYNQGWRNYSTAMLNITGYGWGSRVNNFRMRVHKDGSMRCFQW